VCTLAFASSDVTAVVCKVAGEGKKAWWCAERVLVGTGGVVWHAYQIQLQEVGIANSTPDLGGIEPIFYTRSSYWPVGRRQRKKNFPRRDLPLNRISETKLANELLQQNRALILSPFFFTHRPTKTIGTYTDVPCASVPFYASLRWAVISTVLSHPF
jgi:hypothetical protein